MKKLFAFCLLFGAAVAVHAQDATSTTDETSTTTPTETPAATETPATTPTEAPATSETETQAPSDALNQDQDALSQDQDKDKQAIAATELPEAVRTSLEGQDYSAWTVGQAYKITKDDKVMYGVELTNGTETKMVKFDEQGNKVEEKDKKEDQK